MKEKMLTLVRSKYFNLGIVSLLTALLTFLQLQLSVSRIPFLNAKMTIGVFAWNLLTFWLIVALLMLAFNRPHAAILTWSILSSAMAIANYYILLYHGAPLTFHILKNTATTLDVIDSYRFHIDKYSGAILLCLIVCIAIVVFVWKNSKAQPIFSCWKKRVGIAAACLLLLCTNVYVGVFSDVSFKPKNSVVFSWASSAGEYGFLPLELESHFQSNTFSLMYDHYSEETILNVYNDVLANQTEQPNTKEYPDIVLILNECFYDLEQVVDLNTNVSPLANYYSIENAIKGYVVASGEGGGTNRSEYELLTSVSTSLMPNQTPFLSMDMQGHASVVSLLEAYGYETYAAHCANAANYNRKYSYPALGFDHAYFDSDFSGLESYGNRDNTDESAYKDLIKWYEEPSDKPKLMYLLTYQNHGGWEQNPAELDTVKVNNNLGEYTDQANEYLSSLRLSDEQLAQLLSYFETVDKPVVVCMLGDHGPSFAKNIADPSIPEADLTYLLKSTPMIMWGNYDLPSEDLGYISMNYVVPKLLETAGVPLSPFYRYQLELMDRVPVIISYNTFYDKDMNLAAYDTNAPMTHDVQTYFNICFDHLNENKYPFMFEPIDPEN